MPASIIRPVAASRRHRFRIHGLRALRLCPAVALSLCAFGLAAAEAPSQLSLEKNSFYLSSAGFRIQVANDPAGQKALRALPAVGLMLLSFAIAAGQQPAPVIALVLGSVLGIAFLAFGIAMEPKLGDTGKAIAERMLRLSVKRMAS